MPVEMICVGERFTATSKFMGWDTKRLLVGDDVWDVLIGTVLLLRASPGAVEGALPSRSSREQEVVRGRQQGREKDSVVVVAAAVVSAAVAVVAVAAVAIREISGEANPTFIITRKAVVPSSRASGYLDDRLDHKQVVCIDVPFAHKGLPSSSGWTVRGCSSR
ncbi:hypothetical protein FIE12Z_9458 [Fusarium flagelliforme]|uniref:Uncharacterized protein n=1 Tax=Fusarium flagelliforme TaxID=2675880 RepID=A0A395MEL3_9HYPO|nr:hypothetical protein FIE12Z_9458 [Fusarium flagelliforme]